MKTITLKENSIKIGSENYLADYLINLGIKSEDVDSFLNEPKEQDLDNPYDLNNMEAALCAMNAAVIANKKFFLQVDCDVDGFTSSAIFYQFFKTLYPSIDIQYRLQTGKEHGVFLDTIPEDREVIIIPDAGSMQLDEQEALSKAGKTVIILDHHTVLDHRPLENVIIVNNQDSPNFSNKNLSGAGVVFLFVKAYDEKYSNGCLWSSYMDLAALGIVADMMDTRTLGNNYIIQNGFKQIRNKIFRELLLRANYSIADISNPTKVDVAFYVAPIINGLIRSGKQEEKELFFRAMITDDSNEFIESTNRGAIRMETLYQNAVRIAANAKGRQDSAKKRSSEFINRKIKTEKLDENAVIVVALNGSETPQVDPNITGLAAMELVKTYNKPVLVLREHIDETGEPFYSGSGRSKDFYGVKPLLNIILDSKAAIFAEGHGNAFGTAFSKGGLKSFINYSNDLLKDVDFNNDCIEVDYWFKDSVDIKAVEDFANGTKIYGNGIPQPKFAFSFTMSQNEISLIGKDADTIKFYTNGIDFVMFKQPGLARQLKNSVKNRITVVGRAQINTFNNRPQVIIDSMDIAPVAVTDMLDLI